jgi:hypothetical protein
MGGCGERGEVGSGEMGQGVMVDVFAACREMYAWFTNLAEPSSSFNLLEESLSELDSLFIEGRKR